METVPLNKFLFIGSPLEGKAVPLSEVNDEVFSDNIRGPGAC